MPKLSKEQVKKVAKLANLPLSIDEEEKYSAQLSKILDYIDQLSCADTPGVEPTFNVTPNTNILRKDETAASLSQEESLSNASKEQDRMFVTKGVFEE